ncbi:MAG: competence protein CoiA family protein, partial [Anaerobacillus sp.]
MLTAIGSDGILFNLADHKGELNDLRKLRNKSEYFCPVCGLKMMMKLGEKRIWHFAHQGTAFCNERWEPESNYHLTGKLQLYEWIKKDHSDVKVECYLPVSRQRPDLLLPSSSIAIEYQCSLINNNLLKQRTSDYQHLGLDVYWILGAKRLKINYHQIHSIREMEWAAVSIRKGSPILFYYCPEEKKFALVTLHYSLT